MFRGDLPSGFSIYSIDTNGQRVPLASQEDYQRILNSKGAETVKLYIEPNADLSFSDTEVIQKKPESACRIESDGYEVMGAEPASSSSTKKGLRQVIDDLDFDGVIDNQPKENIENSIASIIENRIYEDIYNDHEILDEQDIVLRQLIDETMKEQMPKILSDLQDDESRPFEEEKIQIDYIKPVRRTKSEKKKSLMQKLEEIGQLIKERYLKIEKELQGELDNIVQHFEGDPNEYYAGRKMPRSIAQKSLRLKQIFSNQKPEEIADFILGLPRDLTLDEIAYIYGDSLQFKQI